MKLTTYAKIAVAGIAMTALVSCGGLGGRSNPDDYSSSGAGQTVDNAIAVEDRGTSIWDIFKADNSDVELKVNKYIWSASLEVLDFLPVQSVDPFSGVIVTGYGTPPGGGRSYRATIFVRDPALDARALHVALQTRGGRAVSNSTVQAVEDAILARARQLRIADGRL